MATNVVTTDEFADWYEALSEGEREAVAHLIGLVEVFGVSVRFPTSSAIEGSKSPLRELRKRGQPIRIIYAFDPRRQAVMLLGGDKTGNDRFYEAMVPKAEAIWQQYLAEQAAGLHDDEE